MTATLFALAPWLAAHSLAAPHLAGPLRLASALLLLGALNGMQLGALSGFEAFGMVARLNLLAGALYLPCMLGGAYLGGIPGATGGLVAVMGGNCLVSHMALHAEARRASVPLSLAPTVRERKVLLGFSLPWMLGSAMIAPANWFCATMLANRTGGYAELGVYNAANQWFLAVAVLPLIIGRAAFPVLTERLSLGDRAGSRWIILSSIRANATIVLPVILVGCLLSRPIMRLYGAAFAAAWPILVIALLTGGLSIVQVPFTNLILAQGHAWTSLLINLAWGLMFYLATHLLIERGAIGLGTARLISTAVSAAATVAAAGLLAHARCQNTQT